MMQDSDMIAGGQWRRHRFSVAPMIDRTDRHCRYFHRQLSAHALLYTEMITSSAIRHGDRARLLDFDPSEHPVVLQLGGNDPGELAQAARIAAAWGYDEINLNCGCPSERVAQGAFGACLMAEPALVAECVRAMHDATGLPVSVKHRIGLGREESYGFVRDFVGTVASSGCGLFVVHARNAWLDGLSPKDNRTIPPLRYEIVHRLKTDFPALRFVLNGGLHSHAQAAQAAAGLDGVMFGRLAYEDPAMLAECDSRYFAIAPVALERRQVATAMRDHARRQRARGTPLRAITRHMLGLCNGLPGARIWRRTLSDARLLAANDPDLIMHAIDQVALDPARV